MPNYKYIARNKTGDQKEDIIDAQSSDDLINILQSRGLIVVAFEETKEGKEKLAARKHRMRKGSIKLDDLITFARQLTALLGAGITLLRALEIISLQIESKRLCEILDGIKKDVSAGNSLKAALSKYPKVFSKLWVNMVETGETTGQLPFALEQLTEYLEEASALQRKIRTALVYPSVVLSVAILAVTVFIVRIIPMFHNIYSGFGAELPVFTRIVFDVCLGIKRYLPLIIFSIISIIFGIRYYGKSYKGRRNLDRIKLNLFIFGNIIREVAAIRFASTLNMLIKSGTPILHALDIAIEVSGNVIIKEMLQNVKQSVREGKGMAEPLIEGAIFPDMLGYMIAVGEESGELASMLNNSAKFYSERVDAVITRLTTLFEPFLIILVGIIVGALVIAMFLPIFGLAGIVR